MERYICTECGKDFALDAVRHYKETHGFTDGTFEEITCCPNCGGGYVKADVCECCGKAFLPEDFALYEDKWCTDCLRKMVTYDTFVQFLKDDAKRVGDTSCGYLEEFYFCEVWNFGFDEMPKTSTRELKRDLISFINSSAKMDLISGSTDFLEKCKGFVMMERDITDAFAFFMSECY